MKHSFSCCLDINIFFYLIAKRGVSVNQPQDVAVDAATGGEFGKDSRLHLLLPLLDDNFAGLPLPYHLLVALTDFCIDLLGEEGSSHAVLSGWRALCYCVRA